MSHHKHYLSKTFFYKNNLLVEEKTEGFGVMWWLYYPVIGVVLRFFLIRRMFAQIMRWYYTSDRSRKKINAFVAKYAIKLQDFVIPHQGYSSFNDFFIRRLSPGVRGIDSHPRSVISPADCKVLAYQTLTRDLLFFVKYLPFTLSTFLNDEKLAVMYEGGSMLIFRLAPYDYHRFHMPVDGKIGKIVEIFGLYHSVNPLVYKRGICAPLTNKRVIIPLHIQSSVPILMIPVGALAVGKIELTCAEGDLLRKGDEVGYFEFGGSTVVVLCPPGFMKIDEIFVDHTNHGFETAITVGERIGFIQ